MVLDSGFSRHIMGDKSKLSDYVSKDGGYVTFGDNNRKNNGRRKYRKSTQNSDKECVICGWTKA